MYRFEWDRYGKVVEEGLFRDVVSQLTRGYSIKLDDDSNEIVN